MLFSLLCIGIQKFYNLFPRNRILTRKIGAERRFNLLSNNPEFVFSQLPDKNIWHLWVCLKPFNGTQKFKSLEFFKFFIIPLLKKSKIRPDSTILIIAFRLRSQATPKKKHRTPKDRSNAQLPISSNFRELFRAINR